MYVVITFHQNFWTEDMMLLFPFPKNVEMGWNLYWEWQDCLQEKGWFWQLWPMSCFEKSRKISTIELGMYPIKQVSKFSFNTAILLGIPGAVYSSSISIPFCLQALSTSIFSPALLQCRYWTWIFYLIFNFLIRPIITLLNSNFSFWK